MLLVVLIRKSVTVMKCSKLRFPEKKIQDRTRVIIQLRRPKLGEAKLTHDDTVIAMAENPSNQKGARHIDTREHFVDQLVKDHTIKLVQCRTNKMVADALTKNLPAPAFEQHRAVMLGEDEAPFTAMMCMS